MSSFIFETAPRIICADGASDTVGALARDLGMSRAFVVTDEGLMRAGLLKRALASLAASGVDVVLFTRVMADPPEAIVLEAVQQARAEHIDGVIGFGGGSSLDTAKLVALLANTDHSLDDIYGVDLARGARFSLIQVPTTSGTGSEVTPIAIVTTRTNEKKGVVSRLLYPDIAVLDATLTLDLPPRVTAMTGIDAMVHAIEAYTSRHKKNILSDSLAVRALQLLSRNIRAVIANGQNLDARRAMLQGSMLAGMAFANAPVAAVHALAYPLGGHFHVPHGLSNALVLLPVLEFNLSSAENLYAQLHAHVADGNVSNEAPTGRAFINEMRAIVHGLGIETRLRDVGVGAEHLEMLAVDAMKVQRLLVNNPRELSHADALELYRSAW